MQSADSLKPDNADVQRIFHAVEKEHFPHVPIEHLRDAIIFALRANVINSTTSPHALAEVIDEYWRQEERHDADRFST